MNFGNVISKITPKSSEVVKMERVVKEVVLRLSSVLNKHKVKIVLGGSVAKNTYIETKDVDIFVKFKRGTKDISQKLVEALKPEFKIRVMHGSRDYVNFTYKKYNIEVVPVFDVKPLEAENTMDISPYHVEYVKRNLVNTNEVRLLKKFCANNGLYGAESYISGFSGYLAELLIIKYRTFASLILHASKWKPGVFIDLMEYYKNKEDALKYMQKSALIVVDPVQKKRNVGAALSEDMFFRFVYLCRTFSENSSSSFFLKKKILTEEELIKRSKLRGTKMFLFKNKINQDKREKELSKLKKKVRKIKEVLEKNEFIVYSTGLLENGTIYFGIANPKINFTKKVYGPPVWVSDENFRAFTKKHKHIYLEGGHLVADEKREYPDAKKLIEKLI